MQQDSSLRFRLLSAAIAALGLGLPLANHAAAVTTYYFDINGSTAGFGVPAGNTYDWDDTTNGGLWSNGGTNGVNNTGGTATSGWVQTQFARFAPTGTPTYTVTVSNTEQVAGVYASTNQNLTINAIGSGTLSVVSGDQGFLVSGSSNKMTINAPISGDGGVAPELSGSLYLYGQNTYAGGTKIGYSGATLTYFNNNNSFGTGPIVNNYAATNSFAALLASGGASITLPNDFQLITSGNGFNFAGAANTPVTSTGLWSLGAKNLLLRNSGGSGSPISLTNTISGTAGITLSANANSSFVFSGANTYSGTTTITGPGGAGAGSATIRLVLGAANAIASSSGVILTGGILDPDAFNQSTGTLALVTSTNASVIDFAAGAAELDFANSSAVSWTGATLNLTNWDFSTDKLRFGTDDTGLTSDQLAKIEFNGAGLGTAILDANGYVTVPEPASLSLLGLAATSLLARKRRA